jgi:hypothetical protein
VVKVSSKDVLELKTPPPRVDKPMWNFPLKGTKD